MLRKWRRTPGDRSWFGYTRDPRGLAASSFHDRSSHPGEENRRCQAVWKLVKRLYDAFAEGDVETVLACMSPEVVWNEAEGFPYADGNPYIGPEAVLHGVFARCIEEWDGFRGAY
jgi:hypothetical protein